MHFQPQPRVGPLGPPLSSQVGSVNVTITSCTVCLLFPHGGWLPLPTPPCVSLSLGDWPPPPPLGFFLSRPLFFFLPPDLPSSQSFLPTPFPLNRQTYLSILLPSLGLPIQPPTPGCCCSPHCRCTSRHRLLSVSSISLHPYCCDRACWPPSHSCSFLPGMSFCRRYLSPCHQPLPACLTQAHRLWVLSL